MTNASGLALYEGKELVDAVKELFSFPSFTSGIKSFLPSDLSQFILGEYKNVKTIFDFQTKLVYPVLQLIQRSSITNLTVSGLERLSPNDKYLFISNHRDIVLDSAYLNMVLYEHGFETSQVAIGDNLMRHRISELLFRINKSFIVKRSGSPRELYQHSVKLSEYIRNLIVEKTDSVWIAQREGRAKDGDDRTQVGLLKMLSLSKGNDLVAHFKSLKIVPVAISYELDPCDLLKTQEHLAKQKDPNFKKTFQEDIQHILLGLRGKKGHIHFHFGELLNNQLNSLNEQNNSKQQLEELAQIIDQQIHQYYRLQAINYIAYDLLHNSDSFNARYTIEQKQHFSNRFQEKLDDIEFEAEKAKDYLLRMYANPVINKMSLGE